ncbi:MAG: glycosyltransferase, partial [Bacteroidota bacterium]
MLLIVNPNATAYSETFIANQVLFLQPGKMLTGGWSPYVDEKGRSIFRGLLSVNVWRGLCRKLLPALYTSLYKTALIRFVRENKITHILVEYGVTGVNITKALETEPVRIVVHFHGFDAYYPELINDKAMLELLFKRADAIVAVSNDMHNQLLDLGAVPDKTVVIPYGVDFTKFRPDESRDIHQDRIVLYVGRFTAKKRPDYTIRSFAALLERVPDVRLVMAGAGELLEESKTLAVELGVDGKIEFTGAIPHTEVEQWMKKSWCFTQHSVISEEGDREGTPNSILEAQAMKLPVVSTRHEGIKEAVVENVTGFLVDEHD